MVRKILFLTLIILNVSLFAQVAKVVALRGEVSVVREGETSALKVGSLIEEKDKILTKDNSKVQVLFTDDTIITIGKNSNFSINKYIFDSKNEPEVKLNFASGVFRVITGKVGKIAPKRFNIKTKTSSIGIRGTQILVDILPNIETIYCTEGIIEIVSLDTNELKVIHAGKLIKIDIQTGSREEQTIPPENLKKLDDTTTFTTSTSSVDVNENSNIETNTLSFEETIQSIIEEVKEEENNNTNKEVNDSVNSISKSNVLMAVVKNAGSDFRSVNNSTFNIDDGVSEDVKININTSSAIYSLLLDDFEVKANESTISQNNGSIASISTPVISNPITSVSYHLLYDDIENSIPKMNTDDKVSWGQWNVYSYSDYNYNSQESSNNTVLYNFGYWIQGETTNESVINTYIGASGILNRDVIANYSGYILGSDASNASYIVTNSSTSFQVNFSSKTLTGNMNFNNTNSYDVSGTLDSSGFSINQVTNVSNATIDSQGKFFGNSGQTMGGDFNINDTGADKQFTGVFISRSNDIESLKSEIDSLNNGVEPQ